MYLLDIETSWEDLNTNCHSSHLGRELWNNPTFLPLAINAWAYVDMQPWKICRTNTNRNKQKTKRHAENILSRGIIIAE
jgi:hypothetical protein